MQGLPSDVVIGDELLHERTAFNSKERAWPRANGTPRCERLEGSRFCGLRQHSHHDLTDDRGDSDAHCYPIRSHAGRGRRHASRLAGNGICRHGDRIRADRRLVSYSIRKAAITPSRIGTRLPT
jgi:hypothetical protein